MPDAKVPIFEIISSVNVLLLFMISVTYFINTDIVFNCIQFCSAPDFWNIFGVSLSSLKTH